MGGSEYCIIEMICALAFPLFNRPSISLYCIIIMYILYPLCIYFLLGSISSLYADSGQMQDTFIVEASPSSSFSFYRPKSLGTLTESNWAKSVSFYQKQNTSSCLRVEKC